LNSALTRVDAKGLADERPATAEQPEPSRDLKRRFNSAPFISANSSGHKSGRQALDRFQWFIEWGKSSRSARFSGLDEIMEPYSATPQSVRPRPTRGRRSPGNSRISIPTGAGSAPP